MPNFPIRYSQTEPPAAGPAVRANLNLDTGQVGLWQTVAKAGGQLAEVGMNILGKIQAAEKFVKESETKLKMDGLQDDLLTTLPTTMDPAARATLIQDAEAKTRALGTTPETIAYANHSLAVMRGQVLTMDMNMRVQNSKDQVEATLPMLLKRGDRQSYVEYLAGMTSNGLITPADAANRITRWTLDSGMEQMTVALGANDLGTAKRIAETLRSPSVTELMTKKDLSYIDSIGSLINAQEHQNIDQFRDSIANKQIALDQADLTVVELLAQKNGLDNEIRASNLPGTDKETLLAHNQSWFNGGGAVDWQRLNGLSERIDRVVNLGQVDTGLEADLTSAFLEGAFGSRGKQAASKHQSMRSRLSSGKTHSQLIATGGVVQAFKSDPSIQILDPPDAAAITFILDQNIREAVAAHPDWTPTQAFQFAQEHATSLREVADSAAATARIAEMVRKKSVRPIVRRGDNAAYDALPPGTVFQDENGIPFTKPKAK